MEGVKWLTIKIWPQNITTGYLYITFPLPAVINYAAVHLVIQCIHISSIQLWASDTLSLSFFSWFCEGRGDYLKEGTYAASADFGQQGLTVNNPLMSNELWYSFLFFFFSNEKGICQTTVDWALEPHYHHSFLPKKWKKEQQLWRKLAPNKNLPHLLVSTACKDKTETLQYFGLGFVAVSKVTVPKKKLWRNAAGTKGTMMDAGQMCWESRVVWKHHITKKY